MTVRPLRKLLVINQYYAPDVASTGRLAEELCRGMVSRGMEVHVVTAQPSYTAESQEAPAVEMLDGVRVHRISIGSTRGRERISIRLIGYLRFLWGAWRMARAIVISEHPDAVLTFHNPPAVGLIGAALAKRYNLRYTYVPYDIHPDILVATSWVRLPRPILWLWGIMNRRILRAAHAVIVLGEGMKRTLVEGKGAVADRVHVIPLWGSPELTPAPQDRALREELGIGDNELLLLYSGNMGIMHTLDPILDAAAELKDEPVRFLFVGGGTKREHLMQRVVSEKLERVTFLPFQSQERFVRLVNASDACLVALQPGMERLAVPCRSFTMLSAGRPLITLMAPEADVAKIVTQTGCGWNVTTSRQLVQLIRRLRHGRQELARRGRLGRQVYENRFSRETIIERYARVIQNNGRRLEEPVRS